MDSRAIFEKTMNHRQPERQPIDIGATTLTSMSENCQAALREFLGFRGEPIVTNSGVDERILKWAGTDFRGVGRIAQLPSVHTKEISPAKTIDCWGLQWELVGTYFEITEAPLRGASIAELKSYKWPEPRIDEKQLADWERQVKELHKRKEYVVIAEHPFYGILELGCWMCGYDEFLMKMAIEPDFVRTFFDIVLEIQLKIIEQYYSVLGGYIDLTTSGDDFGTQNSPMISPQMFEDLIGPYLSARIKRIKELANCYFMQHTCGSVLPLLDKLISCGVDILNPVQTSAYNMEPKTLKEKFGKQLVFWGGVDVQQFLPKATGEQVRQHILYLMDVLGEKGGYVMAPAHNMQDDIPPENIAAWVETVRSRE